MTPKDVARPREEPVTAGRKTPSTGLATPIHGRRVGSVVTAEEERPVGVVTADDPLVLVHSETNDGSSVIRAESPACASS